MKVDDEPMKTPTFAPPVSSDGIANWTADGSAQFPGLVNLSVSAVHVPSDVYDGSKSSGNISKVSEQGIQVKASCKFPDVKMQ